MALMTTRWRKVLLAAATLFAMLSYGGLLVFVFLPLAFGFGGQFVARTDSRGQHGLGCSRWQRVSGRGKSPIPLLRVTRPHHGSSRSFPAR